MKATYIKNVRIVDSSIKEGGILIEDGKIKAITGAFENIQDAEVIDGNGCYASAGLIELHTHGAGGSDFMDGTPEAYDIACDTHLKHGVTTILPTTVAASDNGYLKTLDAFAIAKESRKNKQNLHGMHFEGPFFPLDRAGGMAERFISSPRKELYEKLIEYANGNIARWSAAPELPGAMEFGDYCKKHGILPSIAHTNATFSTVQEGLKHGFTHVTHLYSDMSTITKREGFRIPGVLECAYMMKELDVEVISDACHIPPDLYRLVYQVIGPERIQICSDSVRPAGSKTSGEVLVGSKEEGTVGFIDEGVAKMMDRSAFLGSIALGNELIKRVVKQVGVPLERAIQMMTVNPARILGLEKQKGRMLPGYDADIMLFNDDIEVSKVFYQGNLVSQDS